MFEFTDKRLDLKYKAFSEEKARAWMLTEATRWLKTHGKFDGAPVYAVGADLRGWAERVESFCGMKPGEAVIERLRRYRVRAIVWRHASPDHGF